MKKIELKPWHGIVLFAVQIAIFIFACVPLQVNFGMTGVALTQIILLLTAVIPALMTGNRLKEVFPVKKIKPRQLLAVQLFLVSSFLINVVINLTLTFIFPNQMQATSEGLSDIFTSVPFISAFIVAAVLPGICEEALHRGFIQFTMRNMKKGTLILVSAVIFGIFHLDPSRFLGTAILGAIMCLLMIETKNILIPAIFHTLNNAASVTVTFLAGGVLQEQEITLSAAHFMSSLGVYLILTAAVPFLMILGGKLLHTKEYNAENKLKRKKAVIAAVIICPVLLVGGIMLIGAGGAAVMSTIG